MKLATSYGIELTFLPVMFDDFMDHNAEYSDDVNEVVPGDGNLCSGLSRSLRASLKFRKIPFNECGIDPSCVEISTKPYTTDLTLFRAVRRIWEQAEQHYLAPTARYYNGGGCHIHTGRLGRNAAELGAYTRRMMVFAAQNPWLSWAFAGTVDDINAQPISFEQLASTDGSKLRSSEAECLRQIEYHRREIIGQTERMHSLGNWTHDYERARLNDDNCSDIEEITELRKHIVKIRKRAASGKQTIELSDITRITDKDHVIRATDYGKHGTIEFRAFEMPHVQEWLHEYVRLVDAIVKHVSAQTYTTVNIHEIPTQAGLDAMPWSVRRDGFNAMLVTLGLDPADWQWERVHMAKRMRYYRFGITENKNTEDSNRIPDPPRPPARDLTHGEWEEVAEAATVGPDRSTDYRCSVTPVISTSHQPSAPLIVTWESLLHSLAMRSTANFDGDSYLNP